MVSSEIFANLKPSKSKCKEFHNSNRRQKWSLPDSIIYYISKNPSTPEVHRKLIQSSKYFYIRNQIIVLESLNYENNKKKVCLNGNDKKYVDVSSFQNKFWITQQFQVSHSSKPNFLSSIIHKFFRIDAVAVKLIKQIISFKEFLFLTPNAREVCLHFVAVLSDDDTILSLEKLVEVLPKVKFVEVYDNPAASCITINTVQDLLKLPHFPKIDHFRLRNISDAFKIETFFKYNKNNKHTRYHLDFCTSISDNYKARLVSVIDEIIQREVHDYKPLYIHFNGIDEEKWDKMVSLYWQY